MSAPAAAAEAPLPGSIHFYAELYAHQERRALLRAVHALEAGVRASLRAGLDHQVAHVRLAWWQQEAERAAAGQPAHPLAATLATHCGPAPLGAALLGWVQATQAELAGAHAGDELRQALAARAGGARFALLATLLDADGGAARALGDAAASLHGAGTASGPARAATTAVLAGLAPALQPPLRPLLVWSVLALRRARQGDAAPPEHPALGRFALLGDNWLAWRTARAADAGRIQRFHEVRRP